MKMKIEVTIIVLAIALLLILSVYPAGSNVVLNPPQTPRDFTSDGVYFSVSNQLYATNQSLGLNQIIISDNYVQFNNTGFYIEAPSYINISIDYINADITGASFGTKVLAFYVNTSTGNVFFNISGFSINSNYSIYKDAVLLTYDVSNSTGFVTFNNSDWSEKYFEIYDNQPATGEIEFLFIDNGLNGTIIFTSTPTFNWSLVSNTVQYQLQISNVSDFSYLIVNLSNINEANYPSEYSQNTTRVSFQLPSANALSSSGTYYCRVKAHVKN